MNLSDFYPVVRALAGDRQVHGSNYYDDADLLSALRTVFLMGRNPSAYSLSGTPGTATALTPDIPSLDAASYATIAYHAVIILLTGEDGEMTIKTRAMEVKDSGDRKRDVLAEMRTRLYEIEGGGFAFGCVEEFVQGSQ